MVTEGLEECAGSIFRVQQSETLKMEAACCSKMSVTIYQSIQCNIPEDLTFRFMANLTFQCVEWNSSTIQKSTIKYKECCNISSCVQNFHRNTFNRSTVCGKKCRHGCEQTQCSGEHCD